VLAGVEQLAASERLDQQKYHRASFDCEEPLRIIKGGLAALMLIDDDYNDHRVTKALDFIITPMAEAVARIEKVLDLGPSKGGANG
jgi:hypothetical protein